MPKTEYKLYDNPWLINDIPFLDDAIKRYEGFVYLITNKKNNKKYIGKKSFWSRRKSKISNRRVCMQSDWKSYYGSCESLKKDIKINGRHNFSREIIWLSKTKGENTFYEVTFQFLYGILLAENRDKYYNDAINRFRHYYSNSLIWKETFLLENKGLIYEPRI